MYIYSLVLARYMGGWYPFLAPAQAAYLSYRHTVMQITGLAKPFVWTDLSTEGFIG